MTSEDFNKLCGLLTKAVDEAVKREMQGIDRFIKREVEKQLREYGEREIREVIRETIKRHVSVELKVS